MDARKVQFFRPHVPLGQPPEPEPPEPPRVVPTTPRPPFSPPLPMRRGRPHRGYAGSYGRSVSIRIAVTPSERELFAFMAARDGLTLSQWLRLIAYRGSGLGAEDTGVLDPMLTPTTPRRHRRTR